LKAFHGKNVLGHDDWPHLRLGWSRQMG
jgi:hypothetical protein